MHDTFEAIDLRITGLVQGVGFRPFVYRLANELGLVGSVRNQTDGVLIHAEGRRGTLDSFMERLRAEAPEAADIQSVTVTGRGFAQSPVSRSTIRFVIRESTHSDGEITRISPDLPVCGECLADMGLPPAVAGPGGAHQPRRAGYPFTNCTNCGPRFSIVRALPYDRAQTSMEAFDMCDECRLEYEDIEDRRFHAQPVACSRCGPSYTLLRADGHSPGASEHPDTDTLVTTLARAIDSGRIVAMKGVGGYHLVCDAVSEQSVKQLRTRKRRDGKPFAVMFRNPDTAARFTRLTGAERQLLTSAARPVVIVDGRVSRRARTMLAPSVAGGLHTIGAVLPYMPMHHLLFDRLVTDAIVLTSGNLGGEPIVIDNDLAQTRLGLVAEILLTHNREIVNREDDSVCQVVNDRPRLVRRSRGYVPAPIGLPMDATGIIAFGAEQKNTLCFGRGTEAIISQHIGDVNNPESVDFLTEVLERFRKLFGLSPRLLVIDRHPDYLSSAVAREMNLPTVQVSHHHAHFASCMVEHSLDGNVLGIAFDGTGYGDDGTIWGGEFLAGDLRGYRRFAHFDAVPIPGGDLAADQPWRSGIAYLVRAFGRSGPPPDLRTRLPLFNDRLITPLQRTSAVGAITDGINAPVTSSAGRLFDAVASICGLCLHSTFEAEAPIRLMDLLVPEHVHELEEEAYPFEINGGGGSPRRVVFEEMIRQIACDVAAEVPARLISLRFHTTILSVILGVARLAREELGVERIVLSGGVFQNRFILAGAEQVLSSDGFTSFSNEVIPANDGGISLGQLAVAAAREFVSM